jgi:hypothetical protein
MSSNRLHDSSADLIRRAYAAAESAVGLVQSRQGRPADVGDLFVLPEAGDFPLEWAVVARHPHRPGLFLVVPADTHPLVGSTDLAVPSGRSSGPLSLRCGLGVWLEEGHLRPALRSGVLESEDIDVVLRLQRSGRVRAFRTAEVEEEVPGDPELDDWFSNVLVPAHAKLRSALDASPPVSADSALLVDADWLESHTNSFERNRRIHLRECKLRAATLTAAVLCLGVLGGFLRFRPAGFSLRRSPTGSASQATEPIRQGELAAERARAAEVATVRVDSQRILFWTSAPLRPTGQVQFARNAHGHLYIAEDHQHWYLSVHDLAPSGTGREYALWFLGKRGAVPGGTFTAASGEPLHLSSVHMPASTKAIIITLEPASGAPAPSGPEVLRAALRRWGPALPSCPAGHSRRSTGTPPPSAEYVTSVTTCDMACRAASQRPPIP